MKLVSRTCIAIAGVALAVTAGAQSITAPLAVNPNGVNNLFPRQNLNGPTGKAQQVNYPYEGQCLADPLNNKYFPLLQSCTAATAPSFACPSGRTAGGWDACGTATTGSAIVPFKELAPLLPKPALKFIYGVVNPPAYTPDTAKFPGADYYEIGLHEAWGFDLVKGVFGLPATATPVPNGKQWTGITDANNLPLYTPIWGVGQINQGGGPVTSLLTTLGTCQTIPPTPTQSNAACNSAPGSAACAIIGETCVASGAGLFDPTKGASAWSPGNQYIATWPSISIWATTGRPVVVKWVNEFPNNHVFCPHPEAADYPCAIDRTFMGVKSKIDPALATPGVPGEGVNQYGSPQQPDNSWVTHLHGGDIPPSVDGFAEKWFGNRITSALWNGVAQNFVSPPFENPSKIALKRPATFTDTYTYPMVQDEATIWFHDHTLGKTHHNVIAGPAAFVPVRDPSRHNAWTAAGTCSVATPGGCDYAWLDAFDFLKDGLGAPLYDVYLAVQDRAFNSDGSINFSNGLGQPAPLGAIVPIGYSSVTVGANPQVHPTWIPEYFGDHVLVNGVIWPKKPVDPGWYRLRLVDGSDSRCWTIGFQSGAIPATGANVNPNVPFFVLANDNGYLRAPVPAPGNQLTMCPGERYEILVNFAPFAGLNVTMTNSAPAPFPAGITPFARASPYADMNAVMLFPVAAAAPGKGIGTCAAGVKAATNCIPNIAAVGFVNDTLFKDLRPVAPAVFPPAGAIVRQVYLNERIDGVTLSPLGMQLNGVPFEYKVTETPREGTIEYWQFVNLTADTHPMHPHLVRHQLVQRQNFNVGQYKALLCGSATCQPGPSPGGEMQVVPDVTALVSAQPVPVTALSVEGGWKDASQAPPGMVTTIVAEWKGHWAPVSAAPTAPGYPGFVAACVPPYPLDPNTGLPIAPAGCSAKDWSYESATSGPYVWHCHINSHEDSEMMHTSLVLPP